MMGIDGQIGGQIDGQIDEQIDGKLRGKLRGKMRGKEKKYLEMIKLEMMLQLDISQFLYSLLISNHQWFLHQVPVF